jgi:hypothetical protein
MISLVYACFSIHLWKNLYVKQVLWLNEVCSVVSKQLKAVDLHLYFVWV